MECKTFCGTDITRIEEEINKFLSKGDFDVKFVSQSQGESDYGHIYTISVWFSSIEISKPAQKTTASKKKAVSKPSKKKAVSKKKRAKKKS